MKSNVKILLAILCSVFCVVFLYRFRVLPSSTIWKSYKTVYVEKNYSQDSVLDIFSSFNIVGVLSSKHTQYPQRSKFLPVMLPLTVSGYTYLDLQNMYFSDKSDTYDLYYIPNEYSNTINLVLDKIPVDCGINMQSNFVFSPFYIVSIFFICLFIYSKNKWFFVATGIPLVLFCFSVPHIYICVLSVVCMLSFFCLQTVWNKEKFVVMFFRQPHVCIIAVVFVFLAVFSGFSVFLLACSTLLLTFCLLYFINLFQALSYQKSFFKPVKIKKAVQMNWEKSITSILLIIFVGTVIILFPGSVLFNYFAGLENTKDLYIPGPSQYNASQGFTIQNYEKGMKDSEKTEGRLPSLVNYIGASWSIDTAPYSRLPKYSKDIITDLPKVGDSVEMPGYTDENHFVKENMLYKKVFDSVYLSEQINEMKSIFSKQKYPAGAEKLLYSENSFTSGVWININTVYVSVKAYIFASISLVLAFCLSMYLNYKRKKLRIL